MDRHFRRWLRRQPRWFRRLFRSWLTPPRRTPAGDDLTPSPGVQAFLDGDSMRQVAHFVGDADPGIIDPRQDWPGAVADAHGVVRSYVRQLQEKIKELSS